MSVYHTLYMSQVVELAKPLWSESQTQTRVCINYNDSKSRPSLVKAFNIIHLSASGQLFLSGYLGLFIFLSVVSKLYI